MGFLEFFERWLKLLRLFVFILLLWCALSFGLDLPVGNPDLYRFIPFILLLGYALSIVITYIKTVHALEPVQARWVGRRMPHAEKIKKDSSLKIMQILELILPDGSTVRTSHTPVKSLFKWLRDNEGKTATVYVSRLSPAALFTTKDNLQLNCKLLLPVIMLAWINYGLACANGYQLPGVTYAVEGLVVAAVFIFAHEARSWAQNRSWQKFSAKVKKREKKLDKKFGRPDSAATTYDIGQLRYDADAGRFITNSMQLMLGAICAFVVFFGASFYRDWQSNQMLFAHPAYTPATVRAVYPGKEIRGQCAIDITFSVSNVPGNNGQPLIEKIYADDKTPYCQNGAQLTVAYDPATFMDNHHVVVYGNGWNKYALILEVMTGLAFLCFITLDAIKG